MNILTNGFITIFNGFWSTFSSLTSPVSIAIFVCAGSLGWLARLEVDQLDRIGAKPEVRTH
jgi:hypothetical protein